MRFSYNLKTNCQTLPLSLLVASDFHTDVRFQQMCASLQKKHLLLWCTMLAENAARFSGLFSPFLCCLLSLLDIVTRSFPRLCKCFQQILNYFFVGLVHRLCFSLTFLKTIILLVDFKPVGLIFKAHYFLRWSFCLLSNRCFVSVFFHQIFAAVSKPISLRRTKPFLSFDFKKY